MNELHELMKSLDKFSFLNLSKMSDDPRYARLMNVSFCLESILRDVVKVAGESQEVKNVLTNYSDFYKLKVSEYQNKFKVK
jgi:hypothetical protein